MFCRLGYMQLPVRSLTRQK
uniref:Uncharacterized protein n=1 Tax=Anguilla anguilla TaxID=7936 RepID=A0A0E9W341_ANGAN